MSHFVQVAWSIACRSNGASGIGFGGSQADTIVGAATAAERREAVDYMAGLRNLGIGRTAAAALTGTGLAAQDIVYHYNRLGHLIILALIEIGGLSVLAMGAVVDAPQPITVRNEARERRFVMIRASVSASRQVRSCGRQSE